MSVIIEDADVLSEFDQCVTLANTRHLRIRALSNGEDGPIRELYARLSPNARYLRFFSAVPQAPDALVSLLSSVDSCQRMALVAEYDGGMGRETIGLANFGANDDQDAEIGLVVRDDWQRQGVGAALLCGLLQTAERCGHRRFIVHLLPDNIAIRRLLKRMCDVVATKISGGISEVTLMPRTSASTSPDGGIAAERLHS